MNPTKTEPGQGEVPVDKPTTAVEAIPPARPERPKRFHRGTPEPVRVQQLLEQRQKDRGYIAELEQELTNLRALETKRRQEEALRRLEARRRFDVGMEAARARYADFDQALANGPPLIPEILDGILNAGEQGAEVSYFLAKNPAVCHELCNFLPHVAAERVRGLAFDLERGMERQAERDAAALWYRQAASEHFSGQRRNL